MARWLLFICIQLPAFTHAQETLKPKAISKLLPARIPGYALKGESRSSILTIGSLRYSLCERSFVNRDRTIKILLFDYAEAPIMLNQSISKWNQMPLIETDSITFATRETEYGDVWESSHPRSHRAQLLLSVNKRFFLTLEATHVSIEDLTAFAEKNIDLSKFPR
ncbi:MAG TPA: hypothetical protein VGD65_22000 [Chryseosolibacter sp.]